MQRSSFERPRQRSLGEPIGADEGRDDIGDLLDRGVGKSSSIVPHQQPGLRLSRPFHSVEVSDPAGLIGYRLKAVEQIALLKVRRGQGIIGRSRAFLIGPITRGGVGIAQFGSEHCQRLQHRCGVGLFHIRCPPS